MIIYMYSTYYKNLKVILLNFLRSLKIVEFVSITLMPLNYGKE